MSERTPFWKDRPLTDFSRAEWESLCDGCGRCCLIKLEDEDTGELFYTGVTCRYMDLETCRCTEYERRTELVDGCLQVTPQNAADLSWMPRGCAYYRVAVGEELAPWHPLVSGDPESVHTAGVSVRSFAVSEQQLGDDLTFEDLIIEDLD